MSNNKFDYVNKHKNVEVFKSLGSEDLSKFTLQPITEVYSQFENGSEVYFLDSENKPVKVKSIEKVPYEGRMYDVDVENDIILVERNGLEVWSGNSNNGTITNMTVVGGNYTTGRYGKALSFDGVNDYVNVGISPFYKSGSKQVTFGFWADINANDFDGAVRLIADTATGNPSSNDGFWLGADDRGSVNGISAVNSLVLDIATDGSGYGSCLIGADNAFDVGGGWHHYVVVFNKTTIVIYKDSVVVTSDYSTLANSCSGNFTPRNSNFYMGSMNDGSYVTIGNLDEVRIYNRSLSAQEVYQLYASNLNKYNQTQWYLYVNQSKNATNGLDTGTYTYFASAKDNLGNENMTETRTLTIDTTPPSINIIYPANNTNWSNTGLNVNYTASDGVGLSTCWYSNDTMTANTTLANCGTNITTVTWTEGQHNVTIWVNDTSNNVNSSSVTFTIDTIAPGVNITYPLNLTYNINISAINYTYSGASTCWWSNSSGVWNSTPVSAGTNWTGLISNEGSNSWRVYCNDSANNINSSSVTFVKDTTPPIVTLRSPASGSSYTSNSLTATLAYNVSDANNVTNCTLIVNGVLDSTSLAVNNSNVQLTFSKTFTPGTYNWNVNCSDEVGNIGNSSVWSLTVTAPAAETTAAAGGGGGGGGGISAVAVPEIIVTPDLIKVSSVVNTIKTREIEVYNDGNSEKTIRVSDNNHDIIDISEENLNFKLAPGEKRKIEVRLIAPEKAGVYTGKILVSGKEVLVSIDVSSKELLFDVSIVIPDEFKVVDLGDKLQSQITLIPMGEEPRLDATLNYVIKDFEGRTFLVESDTILVESQKTFKKEFATQNLPEGDYVLSLEVVYPNGVAVSSSHFKVEETRFFKLSDNKLVLIIVSVAVILISVVALIIMMKSYKKRRKLSKSSRK